MLQEPARQGGPRALRLEPCHRRGGSRSAEQRLQLREGPVERRAHTPARRARDQRLPVDLASPTVEDQREVPVPEEPREAMVDRQVDGQDRKSTRLNSSHMSISYAVFCL